MRFAFFGKFVFSCVTLVSRVHCERAAESPVAAAFKTVPLALAIGSSCVGKTQSSKNFFAETRDAAWPTLADGATCGEDDFFVARNDARNVHMFGVADGVGGWRDHGIDPKEFTSALLQQIKKLFVSLTADAKNKPSSSPPKPVPQVKDVVVRSYANLRREQPEILFGSCTLCTFVYDGASNALQTYLLGDSGFVLLRAGKILFASEEQTKGFNFPYQIGVTAGQEADSPTLGVTRTFALQPFDVIVTATDGLFDNLFHAQIARIVAETYAEAVGVSLDAPAHEQPETLKVDFEGAARRIATALVHRAKAVGEDETVVSPFGHRFFVEKGRYLVGGKNDDTTVVVVIVTPREAAAAAAETSSDHVDL